jgi:hypothetical protein
MPDEPQVIPPIRFLRWVLLAAVIAGGLTFYFQHGTRLPAFGAATAAEESTDSTR